MDRIELYIVPNLKKVSGGPKTRASNFKEIFLRRGGAIYEEDTKKKVFSSFKVRDLVYIESATNRIATIDLFALLFLRLRSKNVVVFIRDIYIELFPEEYTSKRGRITRFFNRISNYYLTLIATFMVFPTEEMGTVFFKKNKWFPRRKFSDLPPGAHNILEYKEQPDFTKKAGILYLGSLGYTNSGYQRFLDFSKKYNEEYNFFILSGDKDLEHKTSGFPVHLDRVPRKEIPQFIESNNITFAFHTRPRNHYDDLTYPIKVFDFLSFQIPFISEKHIPLCKTLGNDYPLFASYSNLEEIFNLIQSINATEYKQLSLLLKDIAQKNTYDERYKKLLSITAG